MSFLSKILSKKLQPAWEFTTKGTLWRMLVSEGNHIIGEDRDAEKKSVSFFCLNGETGNVLWRNVQFHEKWWITIEAIHQDVVFFHEYASPDLPAHKKIYALEIATGKLLWYNEELSFAFAHNESVFASKDTEEQRIFLELDLRTGAVLGEKDAQYMNVLRETITPREEQVEFPQPFDFSINGNAELKQHIEKAVSKAKNIQHIEFLEKSLQKDGGQVGKLVVGWYDNVSAKLDQPMLNQELVVIDESSNIIYRDLMNSEVTIAVPDTFFGKGNFVYYIKNKKTLVALRIEK